MSKPLSNTGHISGPAHGEHIRAGEIDELAQRLLQLETELNSNIRNNPVDQ